MPTAVPAYMGYLIIHLCWKISVPVKTRDFVFDTFGVLKEESIIVRAIIRVVLRLMDNFCRQLPYFLIHSIHFFTVFSMESQMMQRPRLPPARILPAVGFPLIYQPYGNKVMVILYDLVLMCRYQIGLFQLGIKAEQGQ